MAEIALAGATAALRQTVGVHGNLVLKEGSCLSRLREDIVWIEREMRHIQAYLEDAEAKQGGSRGANLVIDIRDLAYDVEDIMQKYFPRIASHRGKKFLGCLKSATCVVCYGYDARNFAVEIEGIKRRVEDINRVRQTYGINESSGSGGRDMWDERRSFPHIDEPNVVGFEEHIEDLVAKMLNKELQCHVISIIGMAGLGKTTLAKKFFKSAQHNFERSVWIYVSQQPNIKELLRDIARQVGFEKEKWEENFEVNLFTFLSQHMYVIVLDDMWHIDTWVVIKNVIPTNTKNGSRIILTSRNNYVVIPPQLETIDEQILKRCGGVPLAIVLAAGLLLLRERSENAWKGILDGMGQDEDQCSEIFGLSYKDLPTNLKPCFLYFGLFPEDHEISAFKLVNLWAAEGFIRGSGVREVEDVGDDYLNHLIGRNLIQVVRMRFNGKVRSVRIHDILHDLCIREAKEISFFNTQNDVITCNLGTGVRRVTTHGSNFEDYISLNYRTPKLRSMLSFSGDLSSLGVKRSSKRIIEILSDPTLVLTKLEKLVLSDIRDEILRTWNLSRYENLLSLRLKHVRWWKSELPQHDKLPPNLTKLTLLCIFLKEDPMETLKKLPKL
ncbi:hypothetical protein ACSBR2_005691 [Camellia fascicularis]